MEKFRLGIAVLLTAGWVVVAGWSMGTLARLPGALQGEQTVAQKAPGAKPAKVAAVPVAVPGAPN